MTILKFKDNRQKLIYFSLLGITILDFLIFKEKYLLVQLAEFSVWLIFFLKSKVELLAVKTAILFLLISAVFYLIKVTSLSEHFLNAGIVFILVATIEGFIREKYLATSYF